MINCKDCFHRSQNTTQWMMRSLQERIHDMKGPFVLSWSYQYGKQNWYQHIFWKRGYCVARNLRQIAKVAKTLPSNLWPRLHTIAKTCSRLRVGEQNWKEFFFLLTPFMCKGEDLDDSNTLGTGRVFYWKQRKNLCLKKYADAFGAFEYKFTSLANILFYRTNPSSLVSRPS